MFVKFKPFTHHLDQLTAQEQGLSSTGRIIDFMTKDFPTAISVNATNPNIKMDFEGILITFIGVFFIQISLAIWWTVHLYYMTVEKAKFLRFNLTSMGTSWAMYHLSHFFIALVSMALTSFVSIITGYIMAIPFFTRSNFVVLYIIYISFGIGILGTMNLISSIVTSQKIALIIAFILNGLSSVVSMIAGNGMMVYFLYSYVPTVAWTLTIFPFFNFSKCIADIASNSYESFFNFQASGYGWNEWAHPLKTFIAQNSNRVPASFENCLYCIIAGVVCQLLALYLDLVLPTSINGAPLPFYFFLLPSYWHPKSSIERYYSTVNIAKQASINDPEVLKEIDEALNTNSALRIIQLQKSYASVQAVKNISLTAQQGTCLAVLGHNGAGKTTTVNTLLGLVNPTSGTALVYGHNIMHEQNQIRKLIGSCPQHDILYDTMTAREHCWVYGTIKGLRGQKLQEEIEKRLKEVGLWSVRDKAANTFSGGMKRRLSVAIAFIGDPKVVLLDEPTTGLDPKSKRLIWNLIHRMKQDKLILLTTHSMEEAEKLSDRIVIMAFGQIRCIGNSLSLKSQFGAGYNLTVISQSPNDIKKMISNYVTAHLISENGDSLMFNVPNVSMADLIPIVRHLEKSTIVRDWALSQTTLEEVYLKVTNQSQFGYSQNMRTH
jgi:ABC-type multidrug transport system ATPase subunit